MHCWRHKTPIIYRATSQWFAGMDVQPNDTTRTLRETALEGIENTEFFPAWGKQRLYSMIANRPDWTLSRQRQWGVPMAFFVHKETGELHPRTLELLEEVARRVEVNGIEAWQTLDPQELLGSEANMYEKNRDTLDVWFDSGTTHWHVLRGSHKDSLQFPADLYLEGSDQHRGWFHSSLLTASMLDGIPPYKALLTHGFTVDGEGRKMSKSLGNGVDPHEVANRLGAEIIRLWIASTDYSGELAISEEILKRVTETYRGFAIPCASCCRISPISISTSTRFRSGNGSPSINTRSHSRKTCKTMSSRITRDSSSTRSCRSWRRSAPKISAASISTY